VKIYTKTGDGGETGLFGGRRVGKDDLRVSAYGDVDELNAFLGWALTHFGAGGLASDIRAIQSDLFTLGADLSTPLDSDEKTESRTRRVDEKLVTKLESIIDRLEAENTPLTSFILPGGDPAAAALQVCRAVCRRAERATVRLAHAENVNDAAIRYLNRLSDLLFVMARWVNGKAGAEEPTWSGSDVDPE
jgi:cob(I)alamin adenosyltransferase